MTIHAALTALGRLRHSKGFGIHSPFAFELITKVLRDRRSAYYDYPAVDALSRSMGILKSQGRLLYRIAVRLQPRRVALAASPTLFDIVKLASPAAELCDVVPAAQADFLLASSATADLEALYGTGVDILHRNGSVLFLCLRRDAALRSVWERVNRGIARGMTFTNGKLGLIVGWHHLPRQCFSLWI